MCCRTDHRDHMCVCVCECLCAFVFVCVSVCMCECVYYDCELLDSTPNFLYSFQYGHYFSSP